MTCVTYFWILIIPIHTSRFGNRIKQIWQPLLFINGYLRMEYTLFQDFARKILCLAPPTCHPGPAQSSCTPEFGYRPLLWCTQLGMGPWFVLVSPWFREHVVATCKIGLFVCSLDDLLQKKVVFFLIKYQNGAHLKKGYFWPTFHIFSHQGNKVTKISSAHISLTYIHVFCSPYWLFCLSNFEEKKYEFIRYVFSLVWVWCWFLFVPFRTINK